MTTLLSYDDLKAKGITFSRVHVKRLERAGKFPQHVRLSVARSAWLEAEIDAWISERIADRDRRAAA